MLRLAHVFFIIQYLYVVVDFHASYLPPPSPVNCTMNIRNERNHIFERTFPSLKPNVIFIFVVTSVIFILSLALIFILALPFRKTLFQLLFTILSIYIFHLAITPIASILCILVFQNWCHCCTQHRGLQILLIILSNDVPRNPGPPFHNSFFNFMSWNVNSIAKDDFQRVRLIEAHNSIFNYDLISIVKLV